MRVHSVDPRYWGEQLRAPVRFLQATQALLAEGVSLFIEIGAQSVLTGAIRSTARSSAPGHPVVAVPSLLRGSNPRRTLVQSLASLYGAGGSIDWQSCYRTGGTVVGLPTYAWDHVSYWSGVERAQGAAAAANGADPAHEAPVGADAATRRYELRKLIAQVAQVPQAAIVDAAAMSALGVDSLGVIEIRRRLEQHCNIQLARDRLSPDPTFGELLQALHSPERPANAGGNRTRLAWMKRRGVAPPLVWVHPAGGGIDCYRPLADSLTLDSVAIDASLPNDVAVQESVEELAARYLDAVSREVPGVPAVLGGWSFGGLVAYEMAVQLRAQRGAAPQVVLVDSHLIDEADGGCSPWRLNPIDTKSLPDADAALVAAMFELHLAAARRYQPGQYDGPVLSVRASVHSGAPDLRWRAVAPHLSVETVAGDHYGLLQSPALERVADAVRSVR